MLALIWIAYKYKFGGKELQSEFNLEMYDFGARNYDPALGRWMNIDPLAEKYYTESPFTYTMNNPVLFIDPDGQKVEVTELENSENEEDKWLLFELMISLADISGQTITKSINENGEVTLEGSGPCESNCSEGNDFISYLLDPKGPTIKVFGSNSGSGGFADGRVFLDAEQINHQQQGLLDGGLDPRAMSVGMAFLHETLHTGYGADYFNSDKDNSEKAGRIKVRFMDIGSPGPVVKRINKFREEMGLSIRTNYVPGSVTYKKDGNEVKVKNGKTPLSKNQKYEAGQFLNNN